MNKTWQGLSAMVLACTIWGLSPIYYKALAHVPPGELLAHRTLWSLAIFAGLLLFQGRISALPKALASRRAFMIIAFAALMISSNWGVFIWSVQAGRVTETSLGYYMFPLFSVLLGVTVLRERLSGLQWLAIALATLGVVQLTVGVGAAPWLSLFLGFTFGLYGLVKKQLSTGPVVSVTAEVFLLAPIAAVWLIWVHASGEGQFGGELVTTVMLAVSGLITALPLILFSFAAHRVNLATLGLMQYINPTLQFFCATVVFGEALTVYHIIAFSAIWIALTLYSATAMAQDKARRKSAMTSSTEPPV